MIIRAALFSLLTFTMVACQSTAPHSEPGNPTAGNGSQSRLVSSNGHAIEWGKNPLSRNVVKIVNIGGVICSGFLINSTTVVTAAHCVDIFRKMKSYNEAFGMQVGLQDANAGSGERQFATITAAYVPKEYRPNKTVAQDAKESSTNDYDIAVVTLSNPIEAGMQIPALKQEANVKNEFFFAGYGINQNEDKDSQFGQLRFAPVHLEPNSERSMLSAQKENQYRICTGDSGGPLFERRDNKLYFAGVLSGFDVAPNSQEELVAADFLKKEVQGQKAVINGDEELDKRVQLRTKNQKILCRAGRGFWVPISKHLVFLANPKSEGVYLMPGSEK